MKSKEKYERKRNQKSKNNKASFISMKAWNEITVKLTIWTRVMEESWPSKWNNFYIIL